MPTESAPTLSPQAAMLVDAIERELDPLYMTTLVDFLSPCVIALSRGEVLVGRVDLSGGPWAKKPIAAAYPDGRLTIDGALVSCDLRRLDLAPHLRDDRGMNWRLPLVLPANNAFDVALAWYALIGWQNADQIARRGDGCPECHGACMVQQDHAGAGRLAVECDCVSFDPPDEWEMPREEDAVAREEPGAWFSGADLVMSRRAA